MSEYVLKLFVTGRTPRSERAIANLRSLCEDQLSERYDIEVIDVLERPHLAEEKRIIATPTLIRELPQPLRRIVGDLSDRGKVLLGLDLNSSAQAVPEGADE